LPISFFAQRLQRAFNVNKHRLAPTVLAKAAKKLLRKVQPQLREYLGNILASAYIYTASQK